MEGLSIQMTNFPAKLHPLLEILQHPSVRPFVHALKPQSTADIIAIALFILFSLGHISRGRVWDKVDPHHGVWYERPQQMNGTTSARAQISRDIAQRLNEGVYQCVIFWGSQSGTSERFAETLGRECSTNFGINALVADLSDYDAETIALISKTHFAIFLLSTYGEGDPSDNTTGLWDWVRKLQDQDTRVKNLRYVAFGLGNSNYKYYNRVLDVVVDSLDAAGATALMPRQRADDANGGTEEDFQSWKDDLFAIFRTLGYEQRSVEYQPTITAQFLENRNVADSPLSVHHQPSTTLSSIIPMPIKSARELFTAGNRNCVHLELDLGHHELGYKTGDHIGIWPCNPEEEIDSLLMALGLHDSRHHSLSIDAINSTSRPKLPSPTTLDVILRHHLEICAPVPRKTLVDIAQFAPSPEAKSTLLQYGQSREHYTQLTGTTHITLARLLRLVSPTQAWTTLPLSFVLETLLPLQPRYYSISSSSVISPRRIAVTALVVNRSISEDSTINGLTSNYLLSAAKLPSNAKVSTPTFQHSASIENGTRKVYAHVRKSKFKLPLTSSTPLILISAGTGFAPFRAFLAERAKLHTLGKPVGKALVFFGCRSASSDFIYREELEKLQEQLGDKLEIITAFSRADGQKVYVQDRVAEDSAKVLELLDAGANMYICGKASMAREVDRELEKAKAASGLGELDVKQWTDALKKRGKWKADVWG